MPHKPEILFLLVDGRRNGVVGLEHALVRSMVKLNYILPCGRGNHEVKYDECISSRMGWDLPNSGMKKGEKQQQPSSKTNMSYLRMYLFLSNVIPER